MQRRMSMYLREINQRVRDPEKQEPANSYALATKVVGPFLASFLPDLYKLMKSSSKVHFRDLFFWAVLIGDDELMFEMWKRTDNPIRCSLWGAHLSREMTKRL